jgi:CHAT domain-containing protein
MIQRAREAVRGAWGGVLLVIVLGFGQPSPSPVVEGLPMYASTIDRLMQMHAREPALGYDVAALEMNERTRARGLIPLDVKTIQREVLDDDTALLQYALGSARSYAWAVTRRMVTSHTLPGQATIEAAARRGDRLWPVSHTRQHGREAQRAAEDLGQMLLAPVISGLRVKRLAIVADGALLVVPFGALRLADAPVVHRYEIVNVPSASTLAMLRRELTDRAPAPKLVAVFADPVLYPGDVRVRGRARTGWARGARPAMPADAVRSAHGSDPASLERLVYTRREAEAIRRLVDEGDRLIALDFQANLGTAFDRALADYRIVHFATHGFRDARDPSRSGLVLSLVDEQGRPRHGVLGSVDVAQLRLNANLVVLSACRTGLDEAIRGEGLVGLVRGFMHGGAPRVVASLWDVKDDATSVLMERFYRGMIREGRSPAAALRDAQIWMSKHPRWSAPYYWAGFVLQGDWRPVTSDRGRGAS